MNEYNELNNHALLLLYDFPVVVNPATLDFLVNNDDDFLVNNDSDFLVDN